MAQFALAVENVRGDQDDSGLQRREPEVDDLRPVREEEPEAVARSQAPLPEGGGEPGTAVVEFAEREARRDERRRIVRAVQEPRNWGQIRSAIAHRVNDERRWARERVRALRDAPAVVRRTRYVPRHEAVRYVAPAYYAPADYDRAYTPDYRGSGGLDLGSIAAVALPLLLGSGAGDLGGLGGLGSGLLGGITPTYVAADPYGYDPYADGYAYSDPYAATAYDTGYAPDLLGLGGDAGSLAQLASLALGSGFLGGDMLGLGGLGSGLGYADPFGGSPEALLAQSLGGLA